MALEAAGVSPWNLEDPSFGVRWAGGVGREERDYFFVLRSGEVAGFVCRTRNGAGEEGWGSPEGGRERWHFGRKVEELGVSQETEVFGGIGKDSRGHGG